MTIAESRVSLDEEGIGRQIYECVRDLYPICRSITGDGVRETLRRLQQLAPLTVHEVPSGTEVFDWTVPREWNVRDAYVKNSRGERVIDFRRSNLHVVNYSVQVRARMSLEQLRPHLFTLPDQPEWIPYRTSYYSESWGFCLSQRELEAMEDGEYEVRIDSSLESGSLTYGECYLPGDSMDEILISCHICHPSLANDNLSGVAIAAYLAQFLGRLSLRSSYRMLFIPGTIGSITWLARNEPLVARIRHGLVLACLGDAGRFTYKKSRRGDATIDRAATHVLRQLGDHEILEFSPYGYDERQFCSPGFNLPVGRLSRTPHGRFPEYHTSADDLDFVRPSSLAASFAACLAILDVLENDRTYMSQNPKGEPQLGKRGLYHAIGGLADSPVNEMAMLWVLNLADSTHSLLDMAERSGLPFDAVRRAAEALRDHGLLKEVP
ncbi:MAG: peptidase M28 [Cyanobacteria bacterium 13_1_40CM_2_61_4]|nr:MAG: peptidase M28 [Cyanobacteria bacterium 13_1_40CM_2_61_4]